MYLCKLIKVKYVYMVWQCFHSFGISSFSVLIPVVASRIFGPKNFNAIYGIMSGIVVNKHILFFTL